MCTGTIARVRRPLDTRDGGHARVRDGQHLIARADVERAEGELDRIRA
jgi:hypothetical protein